MRYILLFLIFFKVNTGLAQEKDPKVGLVLSGGGAKGLAHIGVLKVIEEAGVQIDYIGGTSMGAIVGALYASGYTADQLDSIFRETNFNILLQDELPRSAMTFYEKKEKEKYAITLPFDDFNVSFPQSLSKGQNVYNLMSKLTLHVQDIKDFDKLPIPFLAMATDVETGEEVVLDEGYLPLVISASAAIPTLFSPVAVNGRLLTDGGVVNNYPVEELRKRGADFIIGVDVQDSLVDREDLNTMFEILGQISNFQTIKEMKEKVEKTDIYIHPEIDPFSIMSFDQGSKIIDVGETAARKKLGQFKALADIQKGPGPQRREIPQVDSLYIADVRIMGNTSYPPAYVLGKIKLKYPSYISYRALRLGINNLSATQNFNRINFELHPLDKGYLLEMQLEENPNKMLLRLSAHYDDLYKSGVLLNLTRKSLFATNDVASFDVVLGDHFRYEFHYYLDKGFYWSLGLKSRFNGFEKDVFFNIATENAEIESTGRTRLDMDYMDYTSQLYAETLFTQIFSLRLGIEHKYLDISSQSTEGVPSDPLMTGVIERSNYYSALGNLRLDTYNNKYFPDRGVFFNGNFHWYLFSGNYRDGFSPFSIAKGKLGHVFSPSSNLSVQVMAAAGFKIGTSHNNVFDFFLGGYGNDFINNIVPFYGYDLFGLSGDSYMKALVELDYEIFPESHVVLSANFANAENELFGNASWFTIPDYSGYSVGYSRDTFMGPVEIKYAISPELMESQWHFSIGFWF